MDQPKLERMLRLMKLLSGNVDYSIAELAGRLGMSPRTVYRYLDTFKSAGFAVTRLHGDVYKLGRMPRNAVELDKLIYFSEEEAYLVNTLIDQLVPSNSLKANLKQKLSAIYGSTGIAGFVDARSNAAHVEALGKAAAQQKVALLRDYESGHSHTIRDRRIEPFGFTDDYIEVWGYDLEDGRNKVFKIGRIGEVEVLEDDWTCAQEHRKAGRDVFRMGGQTPHRVRLRLGLMAKNLLLEEYPLAAKDLRKLDGSSWLLDTEILDFAGVCRFYLGLGNEIEIVDSPEFEAYVKEFVKRFLL